MATKLDNPVTERMRARVDKRRHRYDVQPAPNPMLKTLLEVWGHPMRFDAFMKDPLAIPEGATIHIPRLTRP